MARNKAEAKVELAENATVEAPTKVELAEKTLEATKEKEADKQKQIYKAMAGLTIIRN